MKKVKETKKKVIKTKKRNVSKKTVTTDENKKKKATTILIIIIFLCFVPSLLIPWLEYWKVSKDVLEVFYLIRDKAIPFAILCLCVAPIYFKYREDRKDEYTYKQMSFTDRVYRYISPDVIQAIIIFSFIGIATLIVKGINETSFIVEIIGDEMLAEALILIPLAIIFYTTWVLYCNRLKTKFDKFKYLIAIILIVWMFMLIATG